MKSTSTSTNWILALVAGLGVGYVVGQQIERHTSGGGGDTPKATATAERAGPTEIPATWIKEDEFGAKEQISFF